MRKIINLIIGLLIITAPAFAATITLDKYQGNYSDHVLVSGEGFNKSSFASVKIFFDNEGKNVCVATVGKIHDCLFVIPKKPNGTYIVSAVQKYTNITATTEFTIGTIDIPVDDNVTSNVTTNITSDVMIVEKNTDWDPLFTFGENNTDRYIILKQQDQTKRSKYMIETILWIEGFYPSQYKKFESKFNVSGV